MAGKKIQPLSRTTLDDNTNDRTNYQATISRKIHAKTVERHKNQTRDDGSDEDCLDGSGQKPRKLRQREEFKLNQPLIQTQTQSSNMMQSE